MRTQHLQEIQTERYRIIESAIAYMSESSGDDLRVEKVAQHVGLSTAHFTRIFAEWAGVSPKRFAQCLTLARAKAALDRGSCAMMASYEAGLSGPSRLHDLTVNLLGMTPREIREKGNGVTLRYGVGKSPFGDLFVAISDRGIVSTRFLVPTSQGEFCGAGILEALADLGSEWPGSKLVEDNVAVRDVVTAAFSPVTPGDAALGQSGGRSRLALVVRGTKFQIKVWEALLKIPPGALVSYDDVAKYIGRPKAVRAVANAIAANPVAYFIPCHRVIRKTGALGGYRWGIDRKAALIAWEISRNKGESRPCECPDEGDTAK